MAKSKKYNFKVIQDGDSWSAKILRRVSSQKTVVSKKQAGFDSESDAQAWAEKEIALFFESLSARNKRRSKPRMES